jgi:hypothetical protein
VFSLVLDKETLYTVEDNQLQKTELYGQQIMAGVDKLSLIMYSANVRTESVGIPVREGLLLKVCGLPPIRSLK